MNSKLEIGVIGLRMGQEHIEGFLNHPNANVKAICDINPEALEKVGTRFGIESRYQSHEEMIDKEDLDIVTIATPNCFHKPMATYALEHGSHVFCEKPIGLNMEEAVFLQQKSEETGKRLMVNFCHRFTPNAIAMKKQIEAGFMGNIYAASCKWLRTINEFSQLNGWFSKKKMSGGGALIDLGVHCLDKSMWLMGFPEPTSVLASTHDYIGQMVAAKAGVNFDVDDAVEAMVKFANGATLTLHVSWAANISEKTLIEYRLLGDKAGMIEQNLNEGYEFEASAFYESQGISYKLGFDHVDNTLVKTSYPYHGTMYHFAEAILNDQPNMANGNEAIKGMKVIDAIYKSAQTGAPVTFG